MNSNGRRNNFFPTGFSIRRFIVQSARAAHASPPIGQRSCDIEKGNFKHDRKFNVEGNLTSGNSNSSKSNNIESTSQNSSSRTSSQTLIQNSQQQQQNQQQQQTSNNEASRSIASTSYIQRQNSDNSQQNICPICLLSLSPQSFFTLLTCNHKACRLCLERYLKNEINESRTDIACPQCSEAMHPSNIEILLKDFPEVINKYEDFMVRRFLLADPDSRWCPAPDCSYAVIASGCASCPRLRCQRPGCGLHFCYHCKAEWHPDQTCDAARASRQSPTRVPSGSTSQDLQHRDDIKPCPRCQVLIVKMDDGSCNHMVCSVCGSEFCWLCMKEISDLHYLSPSGCTFWGKKPWSRKKKLLWQLGILVGAPVGIALVAGIAVPAMIIGIPVWVGKKIYARYKSSVKHKRNCAVLAGVATSILISPVLAGLVVAIGVPILLFYVYGVVPVSLCRAGCGVSTTRDGFKFDFDDETDNNFRNQGDGASADAVSRIGATSIGEVSLSVASGSHIGVSAGHNIVNTFNRESTTALAGSITGNRLEIQADVSSSETASAVTCVSEKSGNTLNDTASTKALAGSILSGKQQLDSSNISEDGISEKVRFDNTVSLISDTKKDNYDTLLSTNQSDQEFSADKTSIGSSHSYRSSEKSFRDELDPAATVTGTTSSTAIVGNSSKRLIFGSRIPKLNAASHKTLSLDSATSVSNNIPENVSLEQEAEEEEEKNVSSKMLTIDTSKNFPENSSMSVAATVIDLSSATKMSPTITTKTAGKQQLQQGKFTTNSNQSKSSLLRNLFFSQSGNDATNNVNRPEESSKGTK